MGTDRLPHQCAVVLIGRLNVPIAIESLLNSPDIPEQQNSLRDWTQNSIGKNFVPYRSCGIVTSVNQLLKTIKKIVERRACSFPHSFQIKLRKAGIQGARGQNAR